MKTTLIIRISLVSLSVFIYGYIFKENNWPGGYLAILLGGNFFSISLILLAMTLNLKKIEISMNNTDEEIDNNNFNKKN